MSLGLLETKAKLCPSSYSLEVIQLDELHLFHSCQTAACASSIPVSGAAASSWLQPMDLHQLLMEMEHSVEQTP